MQIKHFEETIECLNKTKIDPAIQNRVHVFGVHLSTSASVQTEDLNS